MCGGFSVVDLLWYRLVVWLCLVGLREVVVCVYGFWWLGVVDLLCFVAECDVVVV